jgi:outer membrane protein OmpA-like peptidoglycan-associated protein
MPRGATALCRRARAICIALALVCAPAVPARAADRAVDRHAEHPDGVSLHVTGVASRDDSIVVSVEIANAGDRDIRLNRQHSFALSDGAHGAYRLNPPPDNPELRVPAHSRVAGELVFVGPLDPAARRLSLSTNEGVGTPDNPFDDAPVLRLDLPVPPAHGEAVQANHPDGVVLRVRRVVALPSVFAVTLIAVNGNDREIRLNQNDSFVLIAGSGETDALEAPTANRTLAIPPGERLEAEVLFPRHAAGDAARVMLHTNEGTGGTPDNPFDTMPVFKLTVPVDRGGAARAAPTTRVALAPVAPSRLAAPTALAASVAVAARSRSPGSAPAPPEPPLTSEPAAPAAPLSAPTAPAVTATTAPRPPPSPTVSAINPATMSVPQLKAALRAEETEQGMRIVLPTDALFGTNPETIGGSAETLLEASARLIAVLHPREIVVAGHTDGVGRDDDNLMLSEHRAQAVARWLRAHTGPAAPRIAERGYGRTRPLAPNHNADGSDNPEGRQQNRRVEIYLRR